MITKHDLDEAIAECQGQRNPNANTCLMLAAFYTIKKEMFGEPEQLFSYASGPEPSETVGNYGGSEFLEAVAGKPLEGVMSVMDELMDSMKVLQPRIYDSVIRKILGL